MLQHLLSLTRVSAIAHRGGSKLRPENTLAAFDHARTLGVDAVECDVHLARDGEPVVIHDPTLDRTTDARGPVAALTAGELSRVDAGAAFGAAEGFPFRGRAGGVPRLAELLERCDLPFVIEIKGDSPATAERALAVIRDAGALDRVVFGGFSDVVLRAIRNLIPNVPTSASRLEVQAAIRRSYFRLKPRATGNRLFQVPFRFHGRQVFGAGFVRTIRRAQYPLHAWIVDDADDMRRLISWGVTGIISDRPDVAVAEARRAWHAPAAGET
jgi:glycerophosphoryl diester phosphodiesterase